MSAHKDHPLINVRLEKIDSLRTGMGFVEREILRLEEDRWYACQEIEKLKREIYQIETELGDTLT